jgi:hypothetical protein
MVNYWRIFTKTWFKQHANRRYLTFFLFRAVGIWPIVPAPDDRWGWLWRNLWNKDWQGKPKYSEKTCPSATLSTTNPTWLDPGFNPVRRGGKPGTKRLSYGAAQVPHTTMAVVWINETEILNFRTLSNIKTLLKRTFQRLDSLRPQTKSLHGWAQSTDQVPSSEHQKQYKTRQPRQRTFVSSLSGGKDANAM